MNRTPLLILLLVTAAATPACAPDLGGVFSDGSTTGAGGSTSSTSTQATSSGGGDAGGGGAGGAAGAGGSGGSAGSPTTGGGGSAGGPCDSTSPGADMDADGWTVGAGDCNDCDPLINPGVVELADNKLDDDCNGAIDEPQPTCDDAIAIDNDLPAEVARAVDLCKASTGEKDWGVAGGIWALPDGVAPTGGQLQDFHRGHGVLPDFGPNVKPRRGKKLLALSTGNARRPGDQGFQNNMNFDKGYQNKHAPGFPKETPACGAVTGAAYDATCLAISIRVPPNAHSFSYDFSFYAYDFPEFVCSTYNDTFFTNLIPQLPGQPDGNIAVDEMGNPVTLNGANFRVCGCNGGPCMSGMGGNKTYACQLGTEQLVGTGFDMGNNGVPYRGATGWLVNKVPVEPGTSIEIRWGIYDTGDGQFDSTVLIDNWQWYGETEGYQLPPR